jgi:transposase
VFEVGRLRRERRSGGKTDALDAVRAARVVLSQVHPAQPRAGGRREALRALMGRCRQRSTSRAVSDAWSDRRCT